MGSSSERFRQAELRAGRDRDASRAAVTVMKVSSRLSQTIERALADADLTLPQFNVLMVLAAAPTGALPMHAVIDQLIGTPSNLSWLTTRMRERGLITKHRDHNDARVVILTITEEGWSLLEQAMPRVFATEQQLWRHHRRADLRTVATLLEPLLAPDHGDGK